jgi:oligoendopeptidase F
MPARSHAPRRAKSTTKSGLGRLPEWNLNDLYAGIDDPQVERDLDRADAESLAFEQA